MNKNKCKRSIGKILAIGLFLILPVSDVAIAQGIFPSLGSSRSGTSGFQFLKINVDARSAAMAQSNVAAANDGSSLYFNPALAVQLDNSQMYVGHTAYIADISHNFVSYVHKKNQIAFGGSLMYLDSGEMEETNEFNPFGTGRTFRTVHMAAGLSFSQQLSNLFSYGVTTKYVEEKIEEVQLRTVVFDIGFYYEVGLTGLRFSVGLNNFGLDSSPSGETTRQTQNGPVTEDEFEDVSPPSMFLIGAAYDAYSNENWDVLVTGQLTNPSDNSERFSLGTEVTYLEKFILRTGYEFGTDEAILPSAGVGFKLPVFEKDIAIDYGFTTRDRLGSIHRIALKFNL
ncbi:PorV/PorQ family protein [Gracilimonas sp.]|uniref:PorV/PorQ family protein n=1 Tax=Gracilimonas sp. TaxID=1974203 RepID=UPI002871EDFC|nr:PorV/PorQ family protein [Gracilimonas sp.]